jgi:hypothetical protein
MSRADTSEANMANLPNFYLYVDEFQSFANESFADILSEARKYKLNLTIAHQYVEQMAEEVRAAVFGNVGTMVTFRVGAYDAEILEKEFAPTFTAEDLVNLGSYQIYLKLMIDGIGSQPFSARTLPPIEKPPTSSVEEIIRHSRRVYASPKLEVEKKIQEWHDEGQMPKPEKKSDKKYDRPMGDRGGESYKTQNQFPSEKKNFQPRTDFPKAQPVKREYTRVEKPIAPPPPELNDDFKPLSSISLETVKQKSNNQRPVSHQNMNELRSALSSIVKTPTPSSTPVPKVQETKSEPEPISEPQPKIESKPVEVKKPKEIPEAELKALLDVE